MLNLQEYTAIQPNVLKGMLKEIPETIKDIIVLITKIAVPA